jgi:steroid delta-isomerase-like uncharacterized protein
MGVKQFIKSLKMGSSSNNSRSSYSTSVDSRQRAQPLAMEQHLPTPTKATTSKEHYQNNTIRESSDTTNTTNGYNMQQLHDDDCEPQESSLQAKVSAQQVSTVNESGRKITTTTVRVAPPQSTAISTSVLPDTTEQTRTLVKKFIADIWNRGEIDLIPSVCSANLRFNGNVGFDRIGHDGLARMVATIRDALDEYHCEIHSMVVERNKAFCRLRFTGKHVGPLLGFAPTGRVLAWMGATEFTCQNGKILKVWELGDVKSLEEQLLPVTAVARSDHDEI